MEIKEIKDNTYSITVPRGIRYLSDWKEFNLFEFPYILDKQIPGCGFTEFCLTNNQDLVLMSPRKILLENKYDQHKEDLYYVINSYEKIVGQDRDITRDNKSQKILEELMNNSEETNEVKKKKLEFYLHLKNELLGYITSRRSASKPFKIIVTYDSFYLVKQVLKDLNEDLNQVQFIVDEFQSIFTDSTFKSSTELNYLESIKNIKRLCYVSATPMLESYLRLIENFEKLPYYELDWKSDDPMRIKKPKLAIKSSQSAITTAKNIINSYLSGDYEYKLVRNSEGDPEKYYSKEAVIYMNSVNNILNVIKSTKLSPEQVNILCADTPENQNRIKRKLGKGFTMGKVPLKGQPHKMFTFCTRTVYLGADFYSNNARSFIISDANIDTLAVDISLDLPQILGRQRLVENPWKDEAEFYYKSTCNNKIITKEELESRIDFKLNETKKLLSAFDEVSEGNKLSLATRYELVANIQNYKNDYVAVNNIYVKPGTIIKKPVLNKLVVISERRAFEIQQIDYADRFNMFTELENNDLVFNNSQYSKFFEEYEQLPNIYQKLKYLCEFNFDSESSKQNILNSITEKHFKEYYNELGVENCKRLGYNITRINNFLNINDSGNISQVIFEIEKTFKVGDKYSKSDIKSILSKIYLSLDYKAAPKASDLERYFELKTIKLKDGSGKWVSGFELIKKKC